MKKISTLLFLTAFLCSVVNSAIAQLPTASFNCPDSGVCLNGCINFTNLSTNATSYKWLFPGAYPSSDTSANPQCISYYDSAGKYDVTLIAYNSNGSDTAFHSQCVIVYPVPPVPYIYQHYDTLFCTTDTSYVSYQWYQDITLIPGATDTFLVITAFYNYNVMVKNRFGCSIAVGINNHEGVKESYAGSGISLYPNPVVEKFTVYPVGWSSNGVNGLQFTVGSIDIYNALGQLVQNSPLLWRGVGGEVDVSLLPAGVYFLQLTTDKRKWIEKFVKE